MTTAIIAIVGGLIGLALGGELLVRGSVGIARRMGVSNLFTGLVIVGFATSMPEMVASVEAALLGSPELAWGNIAGSNLANSLLILGVTALIAPIAISGLGKRDAAVALAVSVLAWVITWRQFGSPWIGAGLLALLIIYIVWRYLHPRVGEGVDDDENMPLAKLPVAIFLFLIGLGMLVVGGQYLVTGAIEIAGTMGISETVIGLTIVAIGTSLPELAASAAAAYRGKPGLALGNVLGSNIYNVLLIGGVTMTIAPVPVPVDLVDFEWPLVIASAVFLWVLLWRQWTIGRAIGLALLAVFIGNTVHLLL